MVLDGVARGEGMVIRTCDEVCCVCVLVVVVKVRVRLFRYRWLGVKSQGQ